MYTGVEIETTEWISKFWNQKFVVLKSF
jgi:hypothetical protein